MRRTWTTVVGAVAALTLLTAACSSDGGDGGGVGGGTTITMSNTAFEPATLTVSSGASTITVVNEDGFDHTFTLDDDSVNQVVAGGETVNVDVDVSASVGFHCAIHPSMTGTLEVG